MSTNTVIPEIKGVPPGLVAEPLQQGSPHGAEVRGVPAGLIAEPIAAEPQKQTSGQPATVKSAPPQVSGVPAGLKAHPVVAPAPQPQANPSKQIYDQTISQGYTPGQAEARVHEYEYGVAHGLSPERAQDFAFSLQFDHATKHTPTPDEMQQLHEQGKADAVKRMKAAGAPFTEQQADQAGIAYANFYSEARQQGFTDQEAREYANGGPENAVGGSPELHRWWMRTKKNLGEAITPFTQRVGKAVGIPDLPFQAENLLPPRMERDLQFQLQHHAQKIENKYGKTPASIDLHVAELVKGLFSPENVALIGFSHGLGIASETGVEAKEGLTAEKAIESQRRVQKVARTVQELAHNGFTMQMAYGTGQAARQGIEEYKKGNKSEAIGYAVDGLVNGLMTVAGARESVAHDMVARDLDAKAGEVFTGKRFKSLTDPQQAFVIDKMVEDSPQYQKALESNGKKLDKALVRVEKLHNRALRQAWNPNAAARTVADLHEAYGEAYEHNTVLDNLKKAREDAEKAQAEAKEAMRQQRPERRRQAAAGRTEVGRMAQTLADHRAEIDERRQAADEALPTSEVRHEIDPVVDEAGNRSYPIDYWGEENSFGANQGAIYRRRPGKTEWMQADGDFSAEPTSLYVAPDDDTADTMSRLTALRYRSAAAAEQEGGHHIQDANELANIYTDLASGAVSAREARHVAGLADLAVPVDDFVAAREGRLNGPFAEGGFSGYYDGLRQAATDAGMTEEEVESSLKDAGVLAQQSTERNLGYLSRPGDYLMTRKGVRWTLDDKGVLHSEDGNSVPLLKHGLYSNEAMQMAASGTIGWGDERSLQQRRTIAEQARKVQEDIRQHQEDVDHELRLAQQRQGLEETPESLPRVDEPEKATRRSAILSRPPSRNALRAEIRQAVNQAVFVPTDPNSVIQMGANRTGVTPEEYLRQALASDPERQGTTEAKVARLEPGDAISDPFRKDHPWMVERTKDGKLQLRSGNANPIPLDRLNPSKRVRQLVAAGEVKSTRPEFTETDVRRVAFQRPHYVRYQDRMAEEVKDQAQTGTPKLASETEVRNEAEGAARRADAVLGDATRDFIAAQNPEPGATIEDAEKAVDDAEAKVEVAQEAKAQEAKAASLLIPESPFPQKPPISIGLRGQSGVITQNGRDFAFHYELVPVKLLQTSHTWDGSSLPVNPEFPAVLQPRTITPKQARNTALEAELPWVDDKGRKRGFDFRNYADRTMTSLLGPPIVDPNGWTVSGNRRTLRLLRHLDVLRSISDPEQREASMLGQKAAMRSLAESVGISGYPDNDLDYAVVRVLDEPIQTERQAAEMGMLFNEGVSERISRAARGVAYARAFTLELLEDIGRRVEAEDGFANAVQKDPLFFRNIVTDLFQVPTEEYVEWFDDVPGRGLLLNEQGKQTFSKVMLGTFIRDAALLDMMERKRAPAYRALERAAGELAKLAALPDRNIQGKITEALRAAADVLLTDRDKSGTRDQWVATYRPDAMDFLREPPPEPDRMTEAVYRAMVASDAATPRVFSDRLRAFIGNESAMAGQLFVSADEAVGVRKLSPVEAFNLAFKRELKDAAVLRGDGMDRGGQLSEEEYRAALENRELSDPEREELYVEEKKGGRGESPEQTAGAGLPAPAAKTARSRLDEFNREMLKKYGDAFLNFDQTPMNAEEYEKFRGLVEQAQREQPQKVSAPPRAPTAESVARRKAEYEQQEQGYVTPATLREFLGSVPATREHVGTIMRVSRMMAEYVWEHGQDRPEGVEKKDALDWVLRERVAGFAATDLEHGRGMYSDPLMAEKGVADGIVRMNKAADATTFIHEFAHVIFPMLSDEDLLKIDRMRGESGKGDWNGQRSSLTKDRYRTMTEKFAHALEAFLRDENPAFFNDEVGGVLAKVKQVFQRVYLAMRKDPLSDFTPNEDMREIFSKMFHVEGFDVKDDWQEIVRKAKAEERRMKRPAEVENPIRKMAREAGATGLKASFAGKVEDSTEAPVDQRKPVATLTFASDDATISFWDKVLSGETKIERANLVRGGGGDLGIQFNTATRVPPDALYQENPPRVPGEAGQLGLRLEQAKKDLKQTPETMAALRKLRERVVQNLENQIRALYGVEGSPVEPAANPARVLEEVKHAANPNRVREEAHGDVGLPETQRPRGFSPPPHPPRIGNAGAEPGGRVQPPGRRGADASLKEVPGVALEPLRSARGEPVGTTEGETFDEGAWRSALRAAGLPEGVPPPTWALDSRTAAKLTFPGQKEVAQAALSALEQGDGFVLATATGTGKDYVLSAISREWQRRHPDAKILRITKNRTLAEKTIRVSATSFGVKVDAVVPERDAKPGVYITTYRGLLDSDRAKNTHWDLVLADEAGEARNWHNEDYRQGRELMAVTANSEKAVYASATPFHSPSEYGYLNKLGLWKDGEFEGWLAKNFKHATVDGKVVGLLDPAKQAKFRQQLVDRGQMVSQAISYEGFNLHFGVVPVTEDLRRKLERIREGFDRARSQAVKMNKRGLAEKISAFEATYTKNYLERWRLPQVIDLARRALHQGWQVLIFSEQSSQDIFRRDPDLNGKTSAYRELDAALGGKLSEIIPPFPDVYDTLQQAFGDTIGDYSGRGNTMGQRDEAKRRFLQGDLQVLYSTLAGGGIGVDLHDADYPELGIVGGKRPRVAIFAGPAYSGVLQEQAMGRPWRFGVKSDVHAVILATDAEPDVRLMQEKIGPRMKALRASVLGERDSLANAMSTYTTEEKVRARQQALAYDEGNEQVVNAGSFLARTRSRHAAINDWSTINFPSADSAKDRGMKYGTEVAGGADWSNLYQARYAGALPDTPEVAAGKEMIDNIANGIVSGNSLPPGVELGDMEPADREAMVGVASAIATDEVEIPVRRDMAAAARQSMKARLGLPGDVNKWELRFERGKFGRKRGKWIYTGDPADIPPAAAIAGEEGPRRSGMKDIRTGYTGAVFTQEQGILAISRRAARGQSLEVARGSREAGRNIVGMARGYQADHDVIFTSFGTKLEALMRKNRIDVKNPEVMSELWDVKEGKKVSGNPIINAAAEDLRTWFDGIRDELARYGVKLKTPRGTYIDWAKIAADPNYMPHYIDWNATLVDPLTGEEHTLREVMGSTFEEKKRERIIAAIAAEKGYSYNEVIDYLQKYGPNTPVFGHVQRARVLDFPFIKKDWKTLNAYADQASEAIAIEKNFGHDRKKLDTEIARIPSTNGRNTIRVMFDGLLKPEEWSDWTAKVYNAAVAFEAGTKMTVSVTKVPFHAVHIPLAMGGDVRPLVRAMAKGIYDHKEVMENAVYGGTLARQLNVADVASGREEGQGLTHAYFKMSGFNAAYRQTRAIAGESARIWMEQYLFPELTKGNAEEARRKLRDLLLVSDGAIDQAIANGRFSPDDLNRGATAFTNLVLWSDNPLQMPGWARLHVGKGGATQFLTLSRAVRLTYSLASFSLKSTSLIREALWDEVWQRHNPKPLAYAMIAYPAIGQLVAGSGAAATGAIHRVFEHTTGKKHHQDRWDLWLAKQEDTFKHPEAIKFLRWYIDGVTFSTGWDHVRRWADLGMDIASHNVKPAESSLNYLMIDELEAVLGPAYSDMIEMGRSGTRVALTELSKQPARVKHEKEKTEAKKLATQLVPILKQSPFFAPPSRTRPVKNGRE